MNNVGESAGGVIERAYIARMKGDGGVERQMRKPRTET